MRLACPYQLSPTQNLLGNGMQASARNAAAVTYATLNPSDKGSAVTLSNGDLTASYTGVACAVRSTLSNTAGKWYWEMTVDTDTPGTPGVTAGIAKSTAALTSYLGSDANGWSYYGRPLPAGQKINNATFSAFGAAFTTGDVIGIALDIDGGTLGFYKNGASQGTAFSSLSGTIFAAVSGNTVSGGVVTVNFGATAFVHTPPSGYNSGWYN